MIIHHFCEGPVVSTSLTCFVFSCSVSCVSWFISHMMFICLVPCDTFLYSWIRFHCFFWFCLNMNLSVYPSFLFFHFSFHHLHPSCLVLLCSKWSCCCHHKQRKVFLVNQSSLYLLNSVKGFMSCWTSFTWLSRHVIVSTIIQVVWHMSCLHL